MTTYQPIDCNDYDFLEIACMDGYDIDVILESNRIRGAAHGLKTLAGEEFLQIRAADEEIHEIRIDKILEIVVRSKVARFDKHVFSSNKKRAPNR